ncbi:polyamine-modulated factor 1 [Petromyzon marinus]|uniref:polyamine-modulated factor 1 n=1 Tax=Petromyzon marinus TaxID=7757 RepID=UPI003F7221DE
MESPPAEGAQGPQRMEAEAAVGAEERERLSEFWVATDKLLERIPAALKLKHFAKSYPMVYADNPELLKKIHENSKEHLRKAIKEEMDLIVLEEGLEKLLGSLDELAKGAPVEPAWRPSGDPASDVRAHLHKYLQQEPEFVRRSLQCCQRDTAALAQRVLDGRQQIQALQANIAAKRAQWEECYKICQEAPCLQGAISDGKI